MKRFVMLLVFGVVLLVQAVVAHAEGFAVTDFSARGLGLAGGMVGRADDPSAVAYNPAGITQIPGVQIMVGGIASMPTGKVDTRNPLTNTMTTTTTESNIYPAPNIYATFQLNDFAWLGLGVFSRFGLGIEYDSNWPGQYGLVDVKLQTVSFNPNIAVKLSDKLSFAAGLDFMYATMELNRDLTPATSMNLEGDGTEIGFNAALHYTFNNQWKAGLSYRSAMTLGADGDATFAAQVPAIGFVNGGVEGDLFLPDSLAFGLNYTPSDVWNFEAGAVYTLWSKYTDLDMQLASGPLQNPKDWNDTWILNISAEYQVLDWLALRGGYSFETSPVDKQWADYMTPSDGRHRLYTGVGFAWDSWKVDLGYSYIFVKKLDYSRSQALGVGVGTPADIGVGSHNASAHIVGFAVSYAF